MELDFDLLDRMNYTAEENLGDIFVEEATTFADAVRTYLDHSAGTEALESLFRFGMAYRQDELNQRLPGQDDHPAFDLIDNALNALEEVIF